VPLAWQGRPLTFMEVCGTHTMAVARTGLASLLPATVRLISGPGCPVCVTPVGFIDHALALAALPNVTLTTFGDLMRVPGSTSATSAGAATAFSSTAASASPMAGVPTPTSASWSTGRASLLYAKALGADVRVIYSPREAVAFAAAHPAREVVFLGVGFETTAPAVAAALLAAKQRGLRNFTVLAAHKTIPEAMALLAGASDLAVDGFLCPGHVSIVLGPEAFVPLAERFGRACAIAGFEAEEILRGLASLIAQVGAGKPRVDNCYGGAVRLGGNPRARALLAEVFEPCDSAWRGLGTIAHSGLAIRAAFAALDAAKRFAVALPEPREPAGCRCGEVLRGVLDPRACPLFARACTPDTPVGACMVSSEGSCAARYQYGLEAAS